MNFSIEKTIQYWLNGASYDLETGRSLIESKRYPYALFFGHLAIEKPLKAFVVKTTKEHAPFTHSLILLQTSWILRSKNLSWISWQKLWNFTLEARYPDERRDFYKKCTEGFTRKKFGEIEDVYLWLKQKLSK